MYFRDPDPNRMKKFLLPTFFLQFLIFICKSQIPVIIHETFDNNNYGWYESTSKNVTIALKDGKYYFEVPDGGWETFLHPYVDPSKDFSLEATFTQLDGNIDNGIGFLWGLEGDNVNSFTFTTNGNYRIYCS